MLTILAKKLFPQDDPWELKRKMGSLLWGATGVLGVVVAACTYGYLVAHLVMKTGGHP